MSTERYYDENFSALHGFTMYAGYRALKDLKNIANTIIEKINLM